MSGLFGDGAAALTATGQQVAASCGPRVIATRSEVYPDTADVLAWRQTSDGFRIVLTADLADVVARHLGAGVSSFLEPIALHRAFIPVLGWPMFALVLLANALRWWCIATLGSRWSARVIVTPGMPLVRTGPYRYFKHDSRSTLTG